MSPVQSKEHLDSLLELQLEEADAKRKADQCQEAYKDAKAKHELKEKEILDMLAKLNEELPLFEQSEEVPFPFPCDEKVHETTLANLAADPIVIGITIGMVKHIRSELGIFTLGQLQTYLKADKELTPDQQKKTKLMLGEKLGPNTTWALLRGIASYVGTRKKTATSKKDEPKKEEKQAKKTDRSKTKNTDLKMTKFSEPHKNTRLEELAGLTAISLTALHNHKIRNVGECLAMLDFFMKEAPENPPKNYLASRVASHLNIEQKDTQKIIDVVYAYEAEQLTAK